MIADDRCRLRYLGIFVAIILALAVTGAFLYWRNRAIRAEALSESQKQEMDSISTELGKWQRGENLPAIPLTTTVTGSAPLSSGTLSLGTIPAGGSALVWVPMTRIAPCQLKWQRHSATAYWYVCPETGKVNWEVDYFKIWDGWTAVQYQTHISNETLPKFVSKEAAMRYVEAEAGK